MSKYLVIVESPSKAKTITKFLGKEYKILSSRGHVMDLPAHEMGVDIEDNFLPKYIVSSDKEKLVAELQAEAKKADKILIATDDDREGEAIGWHLLNILKVSTTDRKRYDRVAFHEITKTAIEAAVKAPRDININLVDAQQARRIMDRLVGYKLSPLLWKKIARGLSAGRVQSVAVRLVVEKEREIEAFVPEETWVVSAEVEKDKQAFLAELVTKPEIKNEAEVKKWLEKLQKITTSLPRPQTPSTEGPSLLTLKTDNKERPEQSRLLEGKNEKDHKQLKLEGIKGEMKVLDIVKKAGIKTPPAPFTTSTLQQEASSRLGFGVQQTMVIAQQLYEGVDHAEGRTGLITYMRTDSVVLSDLALKQAQKVITANYGKEYALKEPRIFKTKSKGAQEAHEAIRPVNIEITPESVQAHLEPKQYRLYKLIWERTVASQMAETKVENTTVTLEVDSDENSKSEYRNPKQKNTKLKIQNSNESGIVFTAKGQVTVFDGFLVLYPQKQKDEELPRLEKGDKVKINSITGEQKFSNPPARYTEATLVKKLETEGIGRPSTYAPTIATIIDRKYVEKTEDKKLKPTPLGIIVTDFLVKYFADILDYKFTAGVEEDFDKIEEGKKKWQKVIKDFYTPFNKTLESVTKTAEKVEQKSGIACVLCGAEMMVKNGKFGQFLACSGYPTCKHTQPMPEDQNKLNLLKEKYKDEKCPKCGKGMIVKNSKFGEFLACEDYPQCKTTKNIAGVTEFKCPKCKTGDILRKRSHKGRFFYACTNYPTCDYVSWAKPEGICPTCSALMYLKGKKIICSGCGVEAVRTAD